MARRRRRAAIVSYRLAERDGVSVEAAKWTWALDQLGYEVTTVAGAGTADAIIAGLAANADRDPDEAELAAAMHACDLVVVENLCSLPLNARAGHAVARVQRGRPTMLRHHDLPWQRAQFVDSPPPPDDAAWVHITINDRSRAELATRGITATTVYNAFDTAPARGNREATRARLRVNDGAILLLHPTRAIPRKNVPAAVALAEQLGAIYWLLGPAEDGYERELAEVLAGTTVRVIREGGVSVADAYAACDAVVYPSFWEGFGNATIESAIHRRPLAVADYPVLGEIRSFGFEWFPVDDPEPLRAWLRAPDVSLLDHNEAVARQHFSLERLPGILEALISYAGWNLHG